MEILRALPINVGSKIKFYFKHPTAIMIENYYIEPELLKKKWMISQLNRYNWLMHSKEHHCYGGSRVVRSWFVGLAGDGNLARKLYIHDMLDPHGNMNIATFIPNMLERKRAMKKLWPCCSCATTDIQREWAIRCLFGGVYPIRKRPKVYSPRNPWSGKWNLRWKKGGVLWKLSSKDWTPDIWRLYGSENYPIKNIETMAGILADHGHCSIVHVQ